MAKVRPPPIRVQPIDGPAVPPIPQKHPLRFAYWHRTRSASFQRPDLSRASSSAGRRSLRPLSHYEEADELEPESFEVVDRGHPAEFPKNDDQREERLSTFLRIIE